MDASKLMFKDGLMAGELRVPWCDSCDRHVWRPRSHCTACYRPVSGWRTLAVDEAHAAGKSFANISGARNATLTFSASRNDDGNLYRAVFTSSAGKVTTIAALLTVQTKARVKASSEAIVAAFVAEQQQKVLFEERLELAREVYEAVSVALAKRA